MELCNWSTCDHRGNSYLRINEGEKMLGWVLKYQKENSRITNELCKRPDYWEDYYTKYGSTAFAYSQPDSFLEAFETCIEKGGLCLDLGSGNGLRNTGLLQSWGHNVILFDWSYTALKLSISGQPGQVYRVRGDASSLPFQSQSFRLVVACDLMTHIAEWRNVLLEASRVLVKDGQFAFNVHLITDVRTELGVQEYCGKKITILPNGITMRFVTGYEEVSDEVNEIPNLKIEHFLEYTRTDPPHKEFYPHKHVHKLLACLCRKR